MDLYVLGPTVNADAPPFSALEELASESLGFGLGLPLDDVETAAQIIEQGGKLHEKSSNPRFFFTSLGPVTRAIDLDALHTLIGKIKGLALQ